MLKKLFIIAMFAIAVNSASAQDVEKIKSVEDYNKIISSLKGEVVMVNFWATWCSPCRKEFPDLVKLFNTYKEKDFNLIFVSFDDESELESEVIPFLKKNNVDFKSYLVKMSNPDSIILSFDSNWEMGIPTTYLLNKEGERKWKALGSRKYEEFEAEVQKLIN
jgi:thiol-disulfide isomerase/thioredoxin